jgi:E3 ubiquitin-protein ligase BAH
MHSKHIVCLTFFVHLGDVKDPHSCIKITIDDPTSISTSEDPALIKLIPITQQLDTEPLSIKIELVKDSEFFHLLLHELSHAAALHDKEKDRFIGDVGMLEGQLTIAVNIFADFFLFASSIYLPFS